MEVIVASTSGVHRIVPHHLISSIMAVVAIDVDGVNISSKKGPEVNGITRARSAEVDVESTAGAVRPKVATSDLSLARSRAEPCKTR